MMSRRGILGAVLGSAAAGAAGRVLGLPALPLLAPPRTIPKEATLIVGGTIRARDIVAGSISARHIVLSSPAPWAADAKLFRDAA